MKTGEPTMKKDPVNRDQWIDNWLCLTQIQASIANRLETALQEKHQLSLKEFYLLMFLSEAEGQKLKLQQLEDLVGLSQSAISRLVSRFEAKGCGALRRNVCEDDRRAVYTCLTPIGAEKLEKAMPTFKATLAEAFAGEEFQRMIFCFLPEN